MERGGLQRTMLEPAAIRRVDPSGMIDIVAALPEKLREGYRAAEAVHIEAAGARRVFIAGMGGAAIAGDLFVSWTAARSEVGREVLRGYHDAATAAQER